MCIYKYVKTVGLVLKLSGQIQSCQSKKLRFQHRQAGQLQSCPFPAWHSDQSVAVLVHNDQEIRKTPRADLCANKNPVASPVLYRSSTTAAVRMHIHVCLADATKDEGRLSCAHSMCCVTYRLYSLSSCGHAFSVQAQSSITHRLVFVVGLEK